VAGSDSPGDTDAKEFLMRKRKTENGLTVNAIAGTHVVTLGLDLAKKQRKMCLGFALQRTDHTENEKYWMQGMKTFEETDPMLGPGGQVSSHEHPFQTFQWADYSAKPEHEYTYTVIPMNGKPTALVDGDAVSVRIKTETEWGTPHSVFFNRGAVASQEYARRFQNQRPDRVGEAAYKWLSRGLLEAMVAFIGRADGPKFGLYGAIYEFQWPEALQAIRKAKLNQAKVRILYDDIPGDRKPGPKNEEAIGEEHISSICKARTVGTIMHNKFLVLTEDENPIAVWTGSTNWTENGLFGHLNCGHAVEDATIAAAYLEYWKEIFKDEALTDDRIWMADNNPAPPDPWQDDLLPVFSPRKGLKVLEWYAEIADMAKRALFMSFAFGMHKDFLQVYKQNDGVLRFALMEKEGNGKQLAQGRKDIARIRRLPNVVVALGRSIPEDSFECWLEERDKLSAEVNVKYIHTKFMLVDPLSKSPVVVTGSANFSEASTNSNHENMLVIRDDTRVADIYLGEFMRLHTHYAFREAVARFLDEHPNDDWKPNHLCAKPTWQQDYFRKGNPRCLRREYFAG
jgi:phosphatidylserine/phosphatidylglycerophosphate/cardiolipin synthase-like enzyme